MYKKTMPENEPLVKTCRKKILRQVKQEMFCKRQYLYLVLRSIAQGGNGDYLAMLESEKRATAGSLERLQILKEKLVAG